MLGQNFLTDPRAVRRVVDAAELSAGDLVYEAGAGRGRLTAELVRRAARVVAYEIDPGMARDLPRHDRLSVRTGDFLAAAPPDGPFQVVSNIPYVLTSALVTWCLRAPSLRRATLITQWEYARKRTGDYGRWSKLTVRTWPSVVWELAGHLPRTAFRPVPRVDAGILRLTRRPVPLVPPARLARYESMVECGFSGVGGSVRASLGRRYGTRRADAACRAVRLHDTPAGEVWPEQWLTLFRLLSLE
ncbi:23S rRNA (adenine(2058)-N(6))-methyltransferase Erm(O) [Paractinoplanes deccanensis]|uniref:23S rRNA (Adenine(2058)-N(6))-methyltransferase Erm(O) n=1 Tax=Paractinoplanes deccanensis TaxID=113561 RepID=A0ABQ3Y3P9_9ACTN|nr:23S rRNA (adenine(2058)-N(6))-methyltransferase Erm(O) [Actinoplanes deccanensis]